MARETSCAFTVWALGGLVDSVNVWLLEKIGITSLLGISLQPKFTMPWLYARLVWGGIRGLLFLLPLLRTASI